MKMTNEIKHHEIKLNNVDPLERLLRLGSQTSNIDYNFM